MFIIYYLTNLFLFAFVLTKKYNKIKAIEDHFYHKVIKAKCTEAVAGRCSIQKVWGQQLINPNLCVCVCVCVWEAYNLTALCPHPYWSSLNPIQYGHFLGCTQIGGGPKRPLLPKTYQRYPTMMNLGTVLSYVNKIQKLSESRDTPPEFCWNQYLFTGNQQILLYQ